MKRLTLTQKYRMLLLGLAFICLSAGTACVETTVVSCSDNTGETTCAGDDINSTPVTQEPTAVELTDITATQSSGLARFAPMLVFLAMVSLLIFVIGVNLAPKHLIDPSIKEKQPWDLEG